MNLALPTLVSCLALLVYFVTVANVGRARGRYKIDAPAITGDPAFERIFRVQQNTLESLALFLPALWMFCLTVSVTWGAGLGLIWVLARIWYARGYADNAKRRGPGFVVSTLSAAVLMFGALIGSAMMLTRG